MQSRPLLKIITCMIAVTCLQGCLAGAVVEIAAETIEAGVEITGAAVGGVVDIVTLNDDEEEDDQRLSETYLYTPGSALLRYSFLNILDTLIGE